MSFYDSGLKFTCKRCSTCCRYDAGFVFLSESDLDKLTSEMKMNRNNFIDMYCRWIKDKNGKDVLSLREKPNKDCILWDRGCIVYIQRPLQCKTFPFWDSVVSSRAAWNMAASGCPGMNYGEIHSGKSIDEYIQMRNSETIINRQRGLK